MNLFDFRNVAFHSADAYLNYLRKNNKGKEVIRVTAIRLNDDKFTLYLEKRPAVPDFLLMKIKSPLFPLDLKGIVSIICFSDVPANVMIKLKPEYFEAFKSLDATSITFESDFSFIAEAVKDWYYDHSYKLNKPQNSNGLSFIPRENDTVTESQCNAINTALSEDISYIWGAPGTGKTQFVLANCIMEYVKRGQKVLLMAPTNNALEQSIRAILRAFKESNIPSSYILRLGNPTLAFAKDNPEVCLSTASDAKIKRLKDEINTLIAENAQQLEYAEIKNNFEKFKILSSSYSDNEDNYSKLLDEKTRLEEDKNLLQSRLKAEQTLLDSQNIEYLKLVNLSKSFIGRIKCLFSKEFRESLEEKKRSAMQNIKEIKNTINCHLEAIRKLTQEIGTLQNELTQSRTVLEELYAKIVSLAPTKLSSPQIPEISAMFAEYFEKNKDIKIDDTLSATIKQRQTELDVYMSQQKKEIVDRYIVACTVDYAFLHYGEFPQNIDHDAQHLFVDEAAYCPMIKAGVFFSYDIPVTFFGDHMQLPPICEMKEFEVEESKDYAFLWSQPATYFPEIFLENSEISEMFKRFLKGSDMNTENIAVASLNVTHRFGNNLADILNEFIYKFGFRGLSDKETRITVINVPRNITQKNVRTNPDEAIAIKRYLTANDFSNKELAILTPYKNQVTLLKKTLGPSTEISTIHASQGREWDTVIISVVDTIDMYYTDSTNQKSKGLKIINTAISRAKKDLVLVLDYDYWKFHSSYQLIGNIAVKNTDYLESDALKSQQSN